MQKNNGLHYKIPQRQRDYIAEQRCRTNGETVLAVFVFIFWDLTKNGQNYHLITTVNPTDQFY